ncbi:MAG TPA: PH domain-containing protein [Paenibacillus sp.]|uniref:PH domain-containing protein n=1 Tax=Paenibacillus sp. TaxID=58172 RepID=UPI0028D7EA7A|nr:PH domain-containing protein [Paenibacillus sp.]HUC91265.1 PH domain-containing protein [Paenibacillus sp.]
MAARAELQTVRFRVKRDGRLEAGGLLVIGLLDLVILLPHFRSEDATLFSDVTVIGIALGLTLLMGWLLFGISYVMDPEGLIVTVGPFRSKILYSDITRVSKAKNRWVGYRATMSEDTLEIHYRSGRFTSVKLSPADKQRFIEELVRRCPSLIIGPLE